MLKRWLHVLATAYILMFFSEFFFVNEGPVFEIVTALETEPLSLIPSTAVFALWYFGPAAVFLAAISLFRVRSIWALILAGALYGWAVEGIVVWQMYEALPYSISWTPLGWHVIVDVLIGWYGVRYILMKERYQLTAVFAIVLGLIWGIWATWFWGEVAPIPPAAFAMFASFVGIPWVLANIGLEKVGGAMFNPTKIEVGLLIIWAIGLFAINVVPILPMAVLILPPLVLVTLLVLHWNKQVEKRQNILVILQQNVNWRNHALLGLTPIVAAATYPIYYALAVRLPIADILVPGLMLIGFVAWMMAYVKIFRYKRSQKLDGMF